LECYPISTLRWYHYLAARTMNKPINTKKNTEDRRAANQRAVRYVRPTAATRNG
jgi:hypothetical protein